MDEATLMINRYTVNESDFYGQFDVHILKYKNINNFNKISHSHT
jgi:hypothetical protein